MTPAGAPVHVPVTPAQITSNQNNYALAIGGINRLSSDAARNITGFAAGQNGEVRALRNVGSFTITLQHENASSTAANRITSTTGADVALASGGMTTMYYDGIGSRWVVRG